MANVFDEKLNGYQGRAPEGVIDAAVYVNDTLELCWASARSIFGDKATSQDAFAIYMMMDEHIDKNAADPELPEDGDGDPA